MPSGISLGTYLGVLLSCIADMTQVPVSHTGSAALQPSLAFPFLTAQTPVLPASL